MAAGPTLADIQARLVAEVEDIAAGARDWFLHAVPHDVADGCFESAGHEEEEQWAVFVRIARFETRELPPTDSDPKSMTFGYPKAIANPNNEVFAPYGSLAGT